MTSAELSTTLIRDLYTRMLLTRCVNDAICQLHTQGYVDFVIDCRGHEAAQVGSASCIEVGTDFTLPCYRDLGVVLTIGMTPYEVFRSCLSSSSLTKNVHPSSSSTAVHGQPALLHHWGYQKHNTVTGSAPVATQLLHAAGIAFASKLRKASVVTVTYCSNDALTEPDFLEGPRFAALHNLPIIFICEHDCTTLPPPASCFAHVDLPPSLPVQQIDGTDIIAVYTAMRRALSSVRSGSGPMILEMCTVRIPNHVSPPSSAVPNRQNPSSALTNASDPLLRCQQYLQERNAWDEDWAKSQLIRISGDVEHIVHNVLRDSICSGGVLICPQVGIHDPDGTGARD